MSIRIETGRYTAAGIGDSEVKSDTYLDKVVKYVPSDIVGARIAAYGMIEAATKVPTNAVLWIAFAFLLLLTPIWKMKQTGVWLQAAISTGAFGVWVFALGGPFASLSWYNPVFGSLLLIAYTLLTALVNPD